MVGYIDNHRRMHAIVLPCNMSGKFVASPKRFIDGNKRLAPVPNVTCGATSTKWLNSRHAGKFFCSAVSVLDLNVVEHVGRLNSTRFESPSGL